MASSYRSVMNEQRKTEAAEKKGNRGRRKDQALRKETLLQKQKMIGK